MSNSSPIRSKSSILLSILLVFLGCLTMLVPFLTSHAVIVLIGWLIIFSGATQFVHAFGSKGLGHIVWKVLVAITYLTAGFYFLAHPLLGIAALTLALGIFFVAEGVMDLATYFQDRGSPRSGWILFDGAVTLILGLLVWRHWPSSSLWVIGTLVGISMISTGVTRLMLCLRQKAAEPESIISGSKAA